MPISSVDSLVTVLTQLHLLEPLQLEETARELVNRFLDPMALASELVKRNWLTTYQANQIFADQGAELLLGPYVFLELLGEGGMGAVFKARNWKLRKLAALKRIRQERLAKSDSIHRFQREIRAASRLNHPNIVMAYDADEVGGTYYFAMEFVDGTDLGKLVKKQGRLPVADACDYIRQAALGLQHALEQGLVHRDIKPSNLMLAKPKPGQTALGLTVKILDFGLARFDHGSGDESSATLTQTGAVMGTPDYLSPEQARQTHEVDIRSDLYSLGCTFYYLLAGKAPFADATIITAKLLAHQHDEPTPITKLRPEVSENVGAILNHLLAKRPEDRFQTPVELAAALADPAGWFAGPNRRQRGSSVMALPVSGGAAGPHGAVAQASSAVVAEQTADTRERFADLTPGSTASDVKLAKAQQQAEYRPWQRWSLLGAGALVLLVGLLILVFRLRGPSPKEEIGKSQPPSLLLGSPLPLDPWALVAQPTSVKGLKSWTLETRGHRGLCRALVFSPDSRRLATLGDDGTVRLWEVASGQLLQALLGHRPMPGVYSLAWSPDGKTLASGSPEGTVRLWAAETGRTLSILASGAVTTLAWSPNGQTLAVAVSNSVQLWNGKGQKGRSLDDPAAGSIFSLAWSTDNKMLAASCGDRKLRLWNTGKGDLLHVLQADTHNNASTPLAWSPDGKRLASGAKDNKTIHLWDPAGGKLLRSHGPVPNATSLAWVAFGKLATQKEAVLWEAEAGKFLHIRSYAGSLAPDGKKLAVPVNIQGPNANGTFHIVDADTGKRLHAIDGYRWLAGNTMAWSPDSQTLATNGPGATVALWEARTGQVLRLIRDDPAQGLAWAPDSKSLAIASAGNNPLLRLWEAGTGDRLHTLHNGTVNHLHWSPDGKLLAGAWGNTAFIWDVKKGQLRHTFKGNDKQGIHSLAWSPDGKLFLTGWANPEGIGVWDVAANKLLQTLKGDSHVSFLAWALDGKTLASASASGLRLWDLKTPKPQFTLAGEGNVHALAWAPDRRKAKIVSGHEGGKIFIWNAATGQLEDSIKAHPNVVNNLTWLYGSHILASGDGHEVKFWEVKTGKPLRTITGTGKVEFAPDLETLAGNALVNGVRLWNADTGKPRGTLYFVGDQPLAITAQGFYRGKITDLVHLSQLPDGSQEVLSPEEFASKYAWQNDPERVQLLPALQVAR